MSSNDFSSESDEYREPRSKKSRHQRRNKRRKTNNGDEGSVEEEEEETVPAISFDGLFDLLDDLDDDEQDHSFDDAIGDVVSQYLQERTQRLIQDAEHDDAGSLLRRLTRAEVTSIIQQVSQAGGALTIPEAIALRKLKVERERRRVLQRGSNISTTVGVVEGVVDPTTSQSSAQTLDALNCIRKTPYSHSFSSRLHGIQDRISGLIYVDWDSKTPWMQLMEDIREHYQLLHSDREQPRETVSPITYTSLQSGHLNQVHDLLSQSFWKGIDVSDSLEYSPEKCTVVASYNGLVVGVAILSSPREIYITYLAVKPGWDNSGIAANMLYLLITLNPGKDITLHVSANNPAMLLYNRFGFKSEEFIAGFYDAYLDPESRASKNAVRLRLRHH